MNYDAAFHAWGAKVPVDFPDLHTLAAGSCVTINGKEIAIPGPMLSAAEIVSALGTADEWDIPKGFIPIMGDFHDLLCLSVGPRAQEVVIIDDAREVLARFSSIRALVEEAKPCGASSPGRVIKSKSWLGF